VNKILALFRFFYMKVSTTGLKINKISYVGCGVKVKTRNGGTIVCHGKIRLDAYAELEARGRLTIGNHFVLNQYSRIVCHSEIQIGENVVMARFVSILDHDHAVQRVNQQLQFKGYNTAPIKIGNNVWISDKVTILKGVTIGDNVIIGANAVVTKDIPSNVIAGGVPAKVLKHLSE
jgi:acetyltransferase-like isoleucine patch superfamily enzyme